MSEKWQDWRPFPDPEQEGFITAPFGPGVYELRVRSSEDLVLVGSGKCCAYRMSSLVPPPLGQGTRNNAEKRAFVREHLSDIDYRTRAFRSTAEAKACEAQLRAKNRYRFPT